MTYNRGWFGVALGLMVSAGACAVAQERKFDETAEEDGGTPARTDQNPDEQSPGFGGDGAAGCRGLECQRASCEEGSETSLSGVVYTPDGEIPLYNVIVYIPNDELPEITHGATCERCGATALSPLASALTNERGEFTLSNVPVGENIPVVIQIGKWRRVVEVNVPEPCAANEADDGDLTLPKNREEGSLPKIAVAAGSQDPVQCLLRRIGVDDEEFTLPGEEGMIHLFNAANGAAKLDNATLPLAEDDLWSSDTQLADYDMVLLACTGSTTRRQTVQANMDAYLNAGGRVFATHYHALWFQDDSAAASIAEWGGTAAASSDVEADIDTSFPKGAAFSAWLEHVDALESNGKIALADIGDSVVQPLDGAQRWIHTDDHTQFMTFNTPVGVDEAEQCGRAVVSDIHVSKASGSNFMDSCGSARLSAQEKALLFLIMDLSSCVQDDQIAPVTPH